MVSNLKVSIQSTNVCWVVLGLLTGFSPGKSRAQVSNLPRIRSVETLQGHRPGHLGSCDFQGLIIKGHCRSLLPESRRRHSTFSCLHHLMRNKLLSPSWLNCPAWKPKITLFYSRVSFYWESGLFSVPLFILPGFCHQSWTAGILLNQHTVALFKYQITAKEPLSHLRLTMKYLKF